MCDVIQEHNSGIKGGLPVFETLELTHLQNHLLHSFLSFLFRLILQLLQHWFQQLSQGALNPSYSYWQYLTLMTRLMLLLPQELPKIRK
jgi:hypothetical protein